VPLAIRSGDPLEEQRAANCAGRESKIVEFHPFDPSAPNAADYIAEWIYMLNVYLMQSIKDRVQTRMKLGPVRRELIQQTSFSNSLSVNRNFYTIGKCLC